jgi:hypothetical protein
MKTNFTKLCLSVLLITFAFTSNSYADFYACAGTPLTIVGGQTASSTDFASYTWDIRENSMAGNSVHTGTGKTLTHTITTPGKYVIILTVTDANTCSSAPTEFVYYALPPVTASIDMLSNPIAYCTDNASTGTTMTAVVGQATPSNIGNATIGNIQWYSSTDASGTGKAAIPSATATTYQVTQATAGAYYYSVGARYVIPVADTFVGNASTTCGGESAIQTITVNPKPTVTITITTT